MACTPDAQESVNEAAAKINHGTVTIVKDVGNATVNVADAAGKQVMNLGEAVGKHIAVVGGVIGHAADTVSDHVNKIATYSTVLIPENIPQYRVAMKEYQVFGGNDPFNQISFISKPVPNFIAHDLTAKIQYVISLIMPPKELALGQITELMIENGVAYVQLAMDKEKHNDNIEQYKAMVRPIVAKNLLIYPEIHHVIWREWLPATHH